MNYILIYLNSHFIYLDALQASLLLFMAQPLAVSTVYHI